jgi:WD40 repeat protein
VAFSPDGRQLGVWTRSRCGSTQNIEFRIWELASRTEVAVDEAGCEARGDTAAYAPRKLRMDLLATAAKEWQRVSTANYAKSQDEVLRVSATGSVAVLTEKKTGREIAQLAHGDTVGDAVFSPDGRWLATASRDRTLRLWLLGGTEALVAEGCARLPPRYETTPSVTELMLKIPPPRNPCRRRSPAGAAVGASPR